MDYKTFKENRLKRKEPVKFNLLAKYFLISEGLTTHYNTYVIFKAWDKISGAGEFTLNKFHKKGKLYIKLNSSVVRNQLSFQKKELVASLNEEILKNELYNVDNKIVNTIKEIILQ